MPLALIFWFLCVVRAEVERVRCGLLGDGVSGRANVMSDKECRDKNKLLTTSSHQNHGEANNISFSVSPETGWCLRGNKVFLRLCSFFYDFHFMHSLSLFFTGTFRCPHWTVWTRYKNSLHDKKNYSWMFRCSVAVCDWQPLEIHRFPIPSSVIIAFLLTLYKTIPL